MKKIIKMYLPVLFLIGFMTFPTKAETIKIENPADIKYAQNLDQAIESLGDKVMGCFESKGDMAEECMCTECSCKFSEEYASVKKAYNEALKAKPEWEDNTVFYQLEGDPTGYNISFAGLKRQFNVSCEK
ncbi:MAG: hypothetical protein IIC69_03445 [Nanoarchaeota archaeon]|nr:hypothetical protein [Nanoarchaeota archaeon]